MRRHIANLPDRDPTDLSEGSRHCAARIEAAGGARDPARRNRPRMTRAAVAAARRTIPEPFDPHPRRQTIPTSHSARADGPAKDAGLD
jgi:hypothetical protein